MEQALKEYTQALEQYYAAVRECQEGVYNGEIPLRHMESYVMHLHSKYMEAAVREGDPFLALVEEVLHIEQEIEADDEDLDLYVPLSPEDLEAIEEMEFYDADDEEAEDSGYDSS